MNPCIQPGWLRDHRGQAVLEFALMKETYQYVVDVPKKVVEKVKVMVQETYPLVENFNLARMETAQAIRELPDQVTKKIDEIAPKNGPLASRVGFGVGVAGVAMGTAAMLVSTFITPAETAQAMVQGLTNTAQGVAQYVGKATQDPNIVLQDGQKLVNSSVEWIQNSSDYEKGKLSGRAAGEIGLLLVGAGEAKAGLKTVELAEVAAKTTLKEAGAFSKIQNVNYVYRKQLWGRQLPNEYTGSKIDSLKSSMIKNGFDINNPIEVFEYKGKKIIVDGHHRVRASGASDIDQIPVRYITEKELMEKWKYTPEQLELEASNAQAAFEEFMMNKK